MDTYIHTISEEEDTCIHTFSEEEDTYIQFLRRRIHTHIHFLKSVLDSSSIDMYNNDVGKKSAINL